MLLEMSREILRFSLLNLNLYDSGQLPENANTNANAPCRTLSPITPWLYVMAPNATPPSRQPPLSPGKTAHHRPNTPAKTTPLETELSADLAPTITHAPYPKLQVPLSAAP